VNGTPDDSLPELLHLLEVARVRALVRMFDVAQALKKKKEQEGT